MTEHTKKRSSCCCCKCFLLVFVHNILNAYFMGATHSWKPQFFGCSCCCCSFRSLLLCMCQSNLPWKHIMLLTSCCYFIHIWALSGKCFFGNLDANHFSLWNFRFTSFYITGISVGLACFSPIFYGCRALSLSFSHSFSFQCIKKFKGCFLLLLFLLLC